MLGNRLATCLQMVSWYWKLTPGAIRFSMGESYPDSRCHLPRRLAITEKDPPLFPRGKREPHAIGHLREKRSCRGEWTGGTNGRDSHCGRVGGRFGQTRLHTGYYPLLPNNQIIGYTGKGKDYFVLTHSAVLPFPLSFPSTIWGWKSLRTRPHA